MTEDKTCQRLLAKSTSCESSDVLRRTLDQRRRRGEYARVHVMGLALRQFPEKGKRQSSRHQGEENDEGEAHLKKPHWARSVSAFVKVNERTSGADLGKLRDISVVICQRRRWLPCIAPPGD